MKLLIVESPNKCHKIAEYLPGYQVLATVGHFRDLPKGELGVDLATFTPTYAVDPNKADVIARLKSAAAKAEEVVLATDADREGEAIAWHVAAVLNLRNPKRILYTEITRQALNQALVAAGPINQDRVNAQKARRILDRLVGFQVSPLLSSFGPNNSAGRVQSATLHLVVEREKAREGFLIKPYWTLEARYENGVVAKYSARNESGSLAEIRLESQQAAEEVKRRAEAPHTVQAVETEPLERKPKPPFTTSSLQQASSVQLGCKPEQTMALAQVLFEKGAVTYHRTDSIALSEDAIAMARAFISEDFPEALPSQPPHYAQKGSAQGAHEAIRPTSLQPAVPEGFSQEEAALYALIRTRFLASQCKPARLQQTTVTLACGDTLWCARGSVVEFPSFLRYLQADEDSENKESEEEATLPTVAVGEVLPLAQLAVLQKQTQPPPRFTQASLIREMERVGIGRPSTYAGTLATLFAREYMAEEKKQLLPTARGRLIDEALSAAFPELVESRYTADMEALLDEVEHKQTPWKAELHTWYGRFAAQLAQAPARLSALVQAHPELAALVPQAPRPTERSCPLCGKPLLLRTRREAQGEFLSCSGAPSCRFAADPSFEPHPEPCPACNGPMVRLTGKFGPYARCAQRECPGRRDLAKPGSEPCPVCSAPTKDKGSFLSCTRYPDCKGSWDKKALALAQNVAKYCPKCQPKNRLLVPRKFARGPAWACSGYPECTYIEPSAPEAAAKPKARRRS